MITIYICKFHYEALDQVILIVLLKQSKKKLFTRVYYAVFPKTLKLLYFKSTICMKLQHRLDATRLPPFCSLFIFFSEVHYEK